MRVLVTGASGFIGSELVRRLGARHHVVASGREHWNMTDPLPRTFADGVGALDVIVHLAQAHVSLPHGSDELYRVNTASTQRLLEFARLTGAKQFILASSGDVYGDGTGLLKEDGAVRPTGFYAISKRMSELLLEAYSSELKTLTLRLFQPYGPTQVKRLIPVLAERIRSGEPIWVHQNAAPRVSPLFVGDVVRMFERAIESQPSGTINLAGDEVVTVSELAIRIGRMIGLAPRLVDSGKSVPDCAGANERMRSVLGHPEVDLRSGLEQVVRAMT